MVLASFLASWSFGLNFWPFPQFVLWPLLHIQRPKYVQIGKETKHWGQKTKRPKKRGQKTKRPKDQEAKIRGQNERPKWHFKYTQYNATGKKTCPSLSEASDRLSVPYQLSLFTHPDANDRLSFPINFHFSLNPAYRRDWVYKSKFQILADANSLNH